MPPHDAETGQTAVKPNLNNNHKMFQIFQNVQFNVVQHKKYAKEMTKLYRKLDQDTFRESFKNAMMYLFTFGDTSANVDRVIQFVATFCTGLDEEEEFLLFIFDIIFDCQCVSGQSVRYRASQLLAAVLSALGDDASLDDDLCDKLLASQMDRFQDTRGAVRCRAALALQRLQNPMDSNDDVTRAYRFHMSCDPSSSVRRAVVMSIAKCVRNVPYVLERLCDVDEAVRRAAFLHISAINVTQLRVRQRVLTLKVGLTERSPRVRRVVEEILIPGWLSMFKGNIIDLLKAIRLDNANDAKDSQYVAGKLLESLFKRLPVSELLEWLPTDKTLRLIPAAQLSKETAWYWRHLARHLQAADDDVTLEQLLPELVVLVGYIRAVIESPCPSESDDPFAFSTRQHVLHELGCLLKVYDAGDQAGRDALMALLVDALTVDHGPLSADIIRAFVSALEMVFPDVTRRIELVHNIISLIREPLEDAAPVAEAAAPVESTELKMQRARLRVSLNVAMEAQEDAVKEENYALAEECKLKVKEIQKKLEDLSAQAAPPPPPPPVAATLREKISDAATLRKCLTILNCALDTPQITTITPMMRLMFNELEVEVTQNPEIVETALETLALFGMLDKEFAIDTKAYYFVNLIDRSKEAEVTVALRAILDLMCVHGARIFEDETDSVAQNESQKKRMTVDSFDGEGSTIDMPVSVSQNVGNSVEIVLRFVDDDNSDYRLIAVEGLCRLLHLGHLESPTVLSKLLLLWFNPATVDEDMLRQTIGVFFQSFAANVEGAQEQIQRATIPTLRALANAPSSSPIAEIDQEAVVRFIVSLTRVNHELTDSQGAMAMTLVSYLTRRRASSEAGLICRMLALLSPPRDASIATDLANMLRQICEKMPDKQSCRNLTRYLGALEASERISLNKMSHTGNVTEATMQSEDISRLGRATSFLPQPIGRSTHVVINETVEEEPEIDETSPTDTLPRLSEEPSQLPTSTSSPNPTARPSATSRSSNGSETSRPSDQGSEDNDTSGTRNKASDSGSDASPAKKVKITNDKKKKLSINRKGSDSKIKGRKIKDPASNEKEKVEEESEKTGPKKRSRSQRSAEDLGRAQKNVKAQTAKPVANKPSIPVDFDTSNVTVRRSTRNSLSGSGSESAGSDKKEAKKNLPKRGAAKTVGKGTGLDIDTSNVTIRRSTIQRTQSSAGSKGTGNKRGVQAKSKKPVGKSKSRESLESNGSASSRNSVASESLFDSSDETELHTIVYDQDVQQSLLDDSNEAESQTLSKSANVTVPETPDASDESEEEEIVEIKSKGKRNAKK